MPYCNGLSVYVEIHRAQDTENANIEGWFAYARSAGHPGYSQSNRILIFTAFKQSTGNLDGRFLTLPKNLSK